MNASLNVETARAGSFVAAGLARPRPALLAVALGLALALAGPAARGQETEPAAAPAPASPVAASPVAEFIAAQQDAEARAAEGGRAAGSPIETLFELPDLGGLAALDEETRGVALESIREYYRYKESGFQHRRRVFAWQLLSSKIIFVVVTLLVASGIYFSGVQFHAALRPPAVAVKRPEPAAVGETPGGPGEAPAAAPEPAAEEPPPRNLATGLQTTLEAGSGGIKVSSPVLGVIILVISFLFFYLYLVHIYPITEIW